MAAVLCGEGSFAFVGGLGTCSGLFRASIKGGELRLLVVLTGAEHNEVGSVCEGTPWMVQAAQTSKKTQGEMGRGRGQSSGCWCQAGTLGLNMSHAVLLSGGDVGRCVGMVPVPTNPGSEAFVHWWYLLS